MKHPHADLIKAYADDINVTITNSEDSNIYNIVEVIIRPDLCWQIYKKPEKWIKEREAFKRGELVQVNSPHGWCDLDNNLKCDWLCPEYRIKPKTETRWQWLLPNGGSCSTGWHANPFGRYTVKLEYTAQEFEVAE